MVKGGKTVVDLGLKKKKCQFGLKVGLQHIIAEYVCGTLIMMLNSDALYRVKFDSRSIIYIKKRFDSRWQWIDGFGLLRGYI